MRPITIGIPSNTIKMTLWADTEDEKKFPVKGLKTKAPYVTAYGVKYPLTQDEAKLARDMQTAFKGLFREEKR